MIKKTKISCIILSFVFLLYCCTGCSKRDDIIVIKNANIFTSDKQNTVASALVIKDGLIEYVGDDASEYLSKTDRVIDAKGKSVLPGHADGHMHLSVSALTNCYEANVSECYSIPDIQSCLKDYINNHKGQNYA